jgi:rfaE bifunctional protein kinase chain/domain
MTERKLLPTQVYLKDEDISNFAKTSILVAGDVMLDRYWFGDTERISPEAPVPIVAIKKVEERLGGAANVARNGASLGAKVTLLGLVGQDEAGLQVARMLDAQGINNLLQVDHSVPTIVKLRVIARQQQLIRLDFEEEPAQDTLMSKLVSFEETLPLVKAVIFSDYGKGALKHIAQMIEMCRQAN